MREHPLASLIQPIELIISAIVCAALKLISPTTIEHKFSLAARGRESCLNKLAHASIMLSFAHFTCHMPHATQKHQPQLAPNWKFARRGSLFGIRRKEDGTTYSFILAAPQFTITIIFSSSLSLSLLFSSPFWRLRRIKIAAVSSKSQKLQCQHQFSTRQRIFRHLSTQFLRANFGAKQKKKAKQKQS